MSCAIELGTPTKALSLTLLGKQRLFVYPDSGNMSAHVHAILSGHTYPLARLGRGYKPSVIVDIGSNVGASALWFLGANPAARVVCFEPSQANAKFLTENLSGLSGVEIYPWGLDLAARYACMYLGASQCMQNSVVRSIETGESTEKIQLRSAEEEFDRLAIERISILKIDTEGCELPIVRSVSNRLESIDQIYIEYHSEEDRVDIEALLNKRFMLAFACAQFVHRGVNLYVRRDLAESRPEWEAIRIGPRRER